MSFVRFLAAELTGMLLAYWGFFLFVTAAMAGHLQLSGYLNGQFVPGYFSSLYFPPLLIGGFCYLALRRRILDR